MKASKISFFAVPCLCVLLFSACTTPPPRIPTTVAATTIFTPAPTPKPTPTLIPSPAPSTAGVPDVLRAYQDAFNRADLDAALALFADQLGYIGKFDVVTGSKAGVRQNLEYNFAMASTGTIGGCTLEDNVWHCMLTAHDSCDDVIPEISQLHFDLRVRIKDGKIEAMYHSMVPAESQLFFAKLPQVTDWIQANRPGDWEQISLHPFTKPAGESWTQSCKAYVAAHPRTR